MIMDDTTDTTHLFLFLAIDPSHHGGVSDSNPTLFAVLTNYPTSLFVVEVLHESV